MSARRVPAPTPKAYSLSTILVLPALVMWSWKRVGYDGANQGVDVAYEVAEHWNALPEAGRRVTLLRLGNQRRAVEREQRGW